MQYLLILSFFFLLTSVECRWFGQKPIDAAFKRPKLMKYTKYRTTNFVITSFYEEKLVGNQGIEYWNCKSPAESNENSPHPFHGVIYERDLAFGLMWKCTRNVEDGRLSLEPVACQSVERNENYEVLSPGSSRTMNNGSVKHSCDIGDGRLKSVFEFVPGCYHNGIVYQLGDEWQEENQGDKHLVQNVTMECVRSESGYFDKKVTECKFNSEEEYDVHHLGNNSLYIEKFIDYITIRLNNYYEKSDLVIVEDSDGIQSSKRVNTRHLKCVETEPGHVTLINVTEEETGCTYKNQTYLHKSSWVDVTQGAGLRCGNGNEVMKDYCSLNGKMHTLGEELKLSNGCVFVCDEQRNIYICDDLLKL